MQKFGRTVAVTLLFVDKGGRKRTVHSTASVDCPVGSVLASTFIIPIRENIFYGAIVNALYAFCMHDNILTYTGAQYIGMHCNIHYIMSKVHNM